MFYISLSKKGEEQKNVQRLSTQTTTTLINAIDAKDKYTHGHSARVAEHSKKIAEVAGKSPEECEQIYYVALLHDVGKIRVTGFLTTVEHDYPQFHLSMDCFWAELKEGSEMQLLEHEAAKWLAKDELDSVDWLPADVKVVEEIRKTYLGM